MINSFIKKCIHRYAPLAFKRKIFEYKFNSLVPHLKHLQVGSIKFHDNPILILSLPRSGSSWLGALLGTHREVRYLREPVTTRYMLSGKNRISLFSPLSINRKEYESYIKDALNGLPTSSAKVIPYREQWKDLNEKKRLIIKEVNPLALSLYLKHNCQVVYLTRHPYAIAKSYLALSWNAKQLITKKFSQEEMQTLLNRNPNLLQENYAFQQGFIFGWIEANTIAQLASNAMQVRYEDVCAHPASQIKKILNDLSLPYPDSKVNERLSKSLQGSTHQAGKFCLERDATQIGQIVLAEHEIDQYMDVMTGYDNAYTCCNFQQEKELIPRYSTNEPFVKREHP